MPKLFSKLNKKLLLKAISIFCLALIIVFLFICLLIKYFISYSAIEKKLLEITGLKIEFIQPDTFFDYKLNLKAKAQAINIYNPNKSKKFVVLDNPEIIFKPTSLLFGRMYFKKFNVDNISVELTRDNNGKIDILNFLNQEILKNLDCKKINITRINSNIANLDINFKDDYDIKNTIDINLKDIALDISKKNKKASFVSEGLIKTNIAKKEQIAKLSANIESEYLSSSSFLQNLKFDIFLDDVNLFIFRDLAKKYISNDIDSLEGKAVLKIKTDENDNKIHKANIEIKNPILKLEDGKSVAPFKEGVKSEILFALDKNEFKVIESDILAKNLSFKANGSILKPFSKKPQTEFDVKITDTQLNNLIHFIPDNAIFYRPKGIPVLKQSNFWAKLNGDLKIKALPLNIVGNLKAQNVHIPNYPKAYRQNDVNARFMGDKVRIFTRVYTPDNEYVTIDGISNLDDSLYGQYTIKSTSKIDLTFAQKYLVPIQQIIGFNIGPVPIMNIAGFGNINIDTKGTLTDARIFGEFNAYNATAQIAGLDAKLTNAKCKLIFDDRNILFKEIKGKLDNADFLLTGTTNIKGEVKLNAKIDNAKSEKILKIFENSIISKQYKVLTKDISKLDGIIEANIDLIGLIKDFEDSAFFENLAPKGILSFKDNKILLNNGLELDKLSGMLSFGDNQSGKFDFNIGNSKLNFEFESNEALAKIFKTNKVNISAQIFSNKILFSDATGFIKKADFIDEKVRNVISELDSIDFYSKLFLKSNGEVALNNIDLKKLKHNGYVIGLNSSEFKDFKFNSGIIKIENDKVIFDNLNAKIKEGFIKAKGSILNISQNKPIGDLLVEFEDINLEKINKIAPKIKAGNASIKNGSLLFKGNDLKINSLSLDWGSTPIFLNAKIKDIYSAKYIESDFSTIIDEISSDNIINPYLVSPVKITGEIPIKGSFKGNQNAYHFDFSAVLPKYSDISFSGANIGDVNHKREFLGRITSADNIATINNLRLIKYIANQNNKVNPITALKVNGQILQRNDNLAYNDLKISTYTPINVRILNLIFKKSILKKGNFDCNISLNGDIKLPDVNGKINFYDLDIPLYSTQINNIKVNISKKFIDSEILAKNKESDVKLKLHALNKLEPPYIVKDVILTSNKLNIGDLISSVVPSNQKADIVPKQEFLLKANDVVVEKGSFDIKEVLYNKISSQNIKGNLNYKNGLVNLTNAVLDIAQGKIVANASYDVNSTKIDLEAKMFECDSNKLANDFLGLQNQIFGKMNGDLSLSAKDLNTPQGIKNIKSQINFAIDNGKMPKLGSLEYLLRAGNLIKNGILGLSLNNLIEVLTPYKTGEFEKISGKLSISNAEIDDLNILSQGKNLSLFMEGNYSLLENFADIKIYGKLSQNISNALGALGNASISQFVDVLTQVKRSKNEKDQELQNRLDKIPSIEIENPTPRYFKAKVLGDINKDNYIKSFDWI